MAKTFVPIVNTDTFGVWKDRTNQMVNAFGETVTLEDINSGNIIATGDIEAQTSVTTDLISAYTTNPEKLITLDGNLKVDDGEIRVYSLSAGVANPMQFYLDNVLNWTITPTDDHTKLEFIDINGLKLTFDSNAQQLTNSGTALLLDIALLPTELGSKNISGNAATATQRQVPLVLTFDTDVTGTVTIDDAGQSTAETISLTVNGGTGSYVEKWGSAMTVNFSSTTLSGSMSFDGSQDITVDQSTNTINVINDSHSHDTQYWPKNDADNRFIYRTPSPLENGGAQTLTSVGDFTFSNGLTNGVKIVPNQGRVIATGDITAFGTLSDITLKENVEKIEGGLEKVLTLAGYTFNYIGNEEKMTGVIAQEVEKVLPEAVYETESIDGETTKAVRYGNMMGLIIEAIKDLHSEIEDLKSKL